MGYTCHDCKKELQKDEEYMEYDSGLIKCRECHEKDPIMKNYQDCEVYSRVVGYIRPVSQWNQGKVEEFKDRVEFNAKLCCGNDYY